MTDPLFTVISPVYNVARYLGDYFESLENQTIGIRNLQIILVDDGSTDESFLLCEQFGRKYPEIVHVLHKENGGQASARNMGLPLARSEWVTFPDPDDTLSDSYFEEVRRYMDEPVSRETVLFAAHIIQWDEKTGIRADKHPTSFRFQGGDSTTDLTGKPNFIHGNAVLSFFKMRALRDDRLQFDERLRTRFEDGNFIARYLLLFDEPILGLVDEAKYFYRRRADGTSTVQSTHSDQRTYTDVPRYGYLSLLRIALERKAMIPHWLQWLVVYDILWLFKTDVATRFPTRSLRSGVSKTFHELIAEVVEQIEPEVILGFDMMSVPNWILEALAAGYSSEPYVGPVYLGPTDASRNLIQIRYRYTGSERQETIFVRGKQVQARYAKTQTLDILGKTLLKERKLWVSSLGVLRFEIGGRIQKFVTSEPSASAYKFRRVQILRAEAHRATLNVPPRFRQIHGLMRTRVRAHVKRTFAAWRHALRMTNLEDLFLAAVIRLFWIRRAYADAWALMDREFQANDSAEQLYRWIDANKPAVKKWFVLRKASADWNRLKRDGFKLVSYGSYRWKILMLLAAHVVSSHIDVYITNPIPRARYGRPQWHLSFLQHGIIKGDLSQWLNGKNIEVFATSTEDEYHYIAGESSYRYGPKVVRLTGLPRHDALLAKSASIPNEQIDQILIAPTWRQYLVGRVVSASVREQNDRFMQSDYALAWQALLRSETLRDAAAAHGLRLVFMPHPVIQTYLDQFEIPSWVETKSYDGVDVQDVVCRSAVMVTDYSSIAFNMAYLYRPVVYYQFDRERYFAEHIEGDGYFDYRTHGFGPVVLDVAGVVSAIEELQVDHHFLAQYVERARGTFPVRDGRNSERVYKAIKDITKPLSFARGSITAPLDSWPKGDGIACGLPELMHDSGDVAQ